MLCYSSYAKDIRKLFLVGGRKIRRSRKRKHFVASQTHFCQRFYSLREDVSISL